MGFAKDIQELRPKIDALMEVSKMLTPEIIDSINKIAKIDFNKAVTAATVLATHGSELQTTSNGMKHIKNVVDIKNEVKHVSDMQDSIGLVAGKIDEVNKVAEYATTFGGIQAMKPILDDILSMSVKIDTVIDMDESITNAISVEKRLDEKLDEIREFAIRASNSSTLAVDMLNKINIKEKLIDEKLKKMEIIDRGIKGLTITVDNLAPGSNPFSRFNREKFNLHLGIPAGKQGVTGKSVQGKRGVKGNPGIPGSATNQGKIGESGRDGSDFKPSFFGKINRRSRYGNQPVGTSYLSLDEIPTMIYFRKSNALDDWTEGQPFGVSNGGYIDSEEGLNIIDGLDINRLTQHIINELKKQGAING